MCILRVRADHSSRNDAMILLDRRLNYDVFEAIRTVAIGMRNVAIKLCGTMLSNEGIKDLSVHDTTADDDLLETQKEDQV